MLYFNKSRIKIPGYILGLFINLWCISAFAQKTKETKRAPNIVFILANDLVILMSVT